MKQRQGMVLFMVLVYLSVIGLLVFTITLQTKTNFIEYRAWQEYWHLHDVLEISLKTACDQLALQAVEWNEPIINAAGNGRIAVRLLQSEDCVALGHSNTAQYFEIDIQAWQHPGNKHHLRAYYLTAGPPAAKCSRGFLLPRKLGLQGIYFFE